MFLPGGCQSAVPITLVLDALLTIHCCHWLARMWMAFGKRMGLDIQCNQSVWMNRQLDHRLFTAKGFQLSWASSIVQATENPPPVMDRWWLESFLGVANAGSTCSHGVIFLAHLMVTVSLFGPSSKACWCLFHFPVTQRTQKSQSILANISAFQATQMWVQAKRVVVHLGFSHDVMWCTCQSMGRSKCSLNTWCGSESGVKEATWWLRSWNGTDCKRILHKRLAHDCCNQCTGYLVHQWASDNAMVINGAPLSMKNGDFGRSIVWLAFHWSSDLALK